MKIFFKISIFIIFSFFKSLELELNRKKEPFVLYSYYLTQNFTLVLTKKFCGIKEKIYNENFLSRIMPSKEKLNASSILTKAE